MSFCRVFGVRALPLLLAALLGACASVPELRKPAARAAPFDVLGRVLVSYDGRAFTANVRWVHGAQSDDLWLMTPTGQALAHMHENASGATLTSADQTTYRGADVETLTQRGLGWALPIGRMQYWLRGEAVPDTPSEIVERNGEGRTRQLAQDGWRITYDYYPATQNGGLPRRLELVGEAQTLRLVIDTWRDESLSAKP